MTGLCGQSEARIVLHNDESGRCRAQCLERLVVLVMKFVRRIEKNDFGFAMREVLQDATVKHLGSGTGAELTQIVADDVDGRAATLYEDDAFGATAQGFNSNSARPRVCVDERDSLDERRQDTEERFPESVGGGARVQACEAFEFAASEFARDYTHRQPTRTNP